MCYCECKAIERTLHVRIGAVQQVRGTLYAGELE